MYVFGSKSKENLGTLHPDLKAVLELAIKIADEDFSILTGYRGQKEQDEAFENGNSRLKFPLSMHNKAPSLAFDVVPYPLNWEDADSFTRLGLTVLKAAQKLDIGLVWGGLWDSPKDYPHFQLKPDARSINDKKIIQDLERKIQIMKHDLSTIKIIVEKER